MTLISEFQAPTYGLKGNLVTRNKSRRCKEVNCNEESVYDFQLSNCTVSYQFPGTKLSLLQSSKIPTPWREKKTFLRFIGVLQVSLGRTNFWPIFDNNAASVFDRSRTIEFLSEVETMRRGMKETARSLQRGFATRMNSLVCRGSMKELRGVIIRPSKSIW